MRIGPLRIRRASRRTVCPERRNRFAGRRGGGRGGIRTHGRVAPTAVFKTAALNHSATLPGRACGPPVMAAPGAASTAERAVDLSPHSAYLTAHARAAMSARTLFGRADLGPTDA